MCESAKLAMMYRNTRRRYIRMTGGALDARVGAAVQTVHLPGRTAGRYILLTIAQPCKQQLCVQGIPLVGYLLNPYQPPHRAAAHLNVQPSA